LLQLQTERLDLIAATLQHIEAELALPNRLASVLNASVPATWPCGEYDRDAQLYFRDRLSSARPEAIGWYGWYALRRAEESDKPLLIGAGGYFGPPSAEGTVEVGYSIVPEAQRQGCATELLGALVRRAHSSGMVHTVVAHTTEQNPASIGVLLRNGFKRVGAGNEPQTIRFECRCPPA
jgi:[ribosomal protein S5]-alanine N-acetyltransferase